MTPLERYREGYERGKIDNLAGHVAQAMLGMLQADPGGYRAAGYRDGAARAKFRPPTEVTSVEPTSKAPHQSASPLVKQWWAICDSSEFISEETVQYFAEALKLEGHTVEFMIGLSKFTGQACPRCTLDGPFKIHVLGRVGHPACGWTGFMPTGSYMGHQLGQVFHTGAWAAGHLKDNTDRKGEKGGWVDGIFGFLMAAVVRAVAAVFLIPLHRAVTLCQSNQTKEQTVVRVVVLALCLLAFAVLFYKAGHPA